MSRPQQLLLGEPVAVNEFLAYLKQRKLVQWALAYIAAAFALIQVIGVASDSYGWPHVVMHFVFGVLGLGFVVALVLAWYHGERGAQRVSGPELLLIALALGIGGGLLWHFGRTGSSATLKVAAGSADAAKRNRGTTIPGSATAAASSTLRVGAVSPSALAAPIPAKSIAVLPFENLSDDKKNEYFVAGMQDLILTKLADIGGLKVISRTSTRRYASHPGSVKEIARELGVATVLEGSVQRSGDRVLIDVQLIDAASDNHIWAQSYTRTLHDLFGVEGEVAESIARTLDTKLTAAEATRVARALTVNSAALDAYLRGEYHMAAFDHGEVKSEVVDAVREYSEAVKLDPGFALAWARLANAQVFLHAMSRSDSNLAARLGGAAKDSLQHAFALQPDLAEAFLSQGIYDIWVTGDEDAALDAFVRARALQPQNAGTWSWVAYVLMGRDKWKEAAAAVRHEALLDPNGSPSRLALIAWHLGDLAQAEVLYKRALALAPDSWVTLDSLANLYAYLGDLARLGQLIESASPAIRTNPNFVDTVGMYLVYRRDWNAARKLYAGAKEPQNLYAAYYPIEVKRGDAEWYAGDRAAARAQYLRAVPFIEAMQRLYPKSRRWHAELGWVYARLGRDADALQQGRLASSADDSSRGAVRYAPHGALALARIEAQVGEGPDAIASLDKLLAMPTGTLVSVPLLKLDPVWDPIRDDPRFQALLRKYPSPGPPSATSVAPAAATDGEADGSG
jgi:TolB-like protein/Flp pilus assembly protein TadD